MPRITPPQTDIINKLTSWKIIPDEIPTKYYNRNAKILNILFHVQIRNNIIYIISFIQYYLSHNVLYVDVLIRLFLRKLIISFLLKMSVAFLFNSHRVIWYVVKISIISIKSIFLSVNFCFFKNWNYCMGGVFQGVNDETDECTGTDALGNFISLILNDSMIYRLPIFSFKNFRNKWISTC